MIMRQNCKMSGGGRLWVLAMVTVIQSVIIILHFSHTFTLINILHFITQIYSDSEVTFSS